MDTRRAARRVSGGRQGEGHQRAASSLAGGGHLTAVRAGQVGRDREADTAAGDAAASWPRKNRSKMCGSSSAGMPGPVSVTCSTAPGPDLLVRTVTCPPGGVNFSALLTGW